MQINHIASSQSHVKSTDSLTFCTKLLKSVLLLLCFYDFTVICRKKNIQRRSNIMNFWTRKAWLKTTGYVFISNSYNCIVFDKIKSRSDSNFIIHHCAQVLQNNIIYRHVRIKTWNSVVFLMKYQENSNCYLKANNHFFITLNDYFPLSTLDCNHDIESSGTNEGIWWGSPSLL